MWGWLKISLGRQKSYGGVVIRTNGALLDFLIENLLSNYSRRWRVLKFTLEMSQRRALNGTPQLRMTLQTFFEITARIHQGSTRVYLRFMTRYAFVNRYIMHNEYTNYKFIFFLIINYVETFYNDRSQLNIYK